MAHALLLLLAAAAAPIDVGDRKQLFIDDKFIAERDRVELRAWEQADVWDRLHADLLRPLRTANRLDTDSVVIDGVYVRAFGGGQTSPSPAARGKPGTKHTLKVGRDGVPLAIGAAGANESDHTQIIPLLPDFPRVGGKPRRPEELPDVPYADRGYDSDAARWLLRWLGVKPRIARRNTPHGSGLGRVRWVMERTIGLAGGATPDAGAVRPVRRRAGRLHDARGRHHLLPHPAPRRHGASWVLSAPVNSNYSVRELRWSIARTQPLDIGL